MFKWLGVIVGLLFGLFLVLLLVAQFVVGGRLNREFDIQVTTVDVPRDEATIERGRHIVESYGFCQECHGDNLEGDVVQDDPFFGRIVAANLTPGRGGIGASHWQLQRHRLCKGNSTWSTT